MKTLVLKAQEKCSDENLRGMNELRVKCISTGTGEGKTLLRPFQSDGTYKGIIQYRVLSGNGYLSDNSNINRGASYDTQNQMGIVVPSGESIVQIKNFDLMTDVIGYAGSQFASKTSNSNCPIILIDFAELKNKTFLKQINHSHFTGDISNLAGLTEITFVTLGTNDYPRTGKLSALSNLKKLETLNSADTNNTTNCTISYSLEDLVPMSSLSHVVWTCGGTFEGGDVYNLLKNKSYVDFQIQRFTAKIENATCSYVSGTSAIPKFTLKTLKLSQVSDSGVKYITLDVAKSILTLVKDGINAHTSDATKGITLETGAAVTLGMIGTADAELNNLKSEVEALGVTVTIVG